MAKTQAQSSGWYEDADNGDMMRWWNGAEWTEHRRPVTVHIAHEQFKLTRKMEQHLSSIRAILQFYLVITVIGFIALIVYNNTQH